MYCYVDDSLVLTEQVREEQVPRGAAVSDKGIETPQTDMAQSDPSVEKLIHLALPVRLIHMQNGERGGMEFACTYDIHPRGARLRSSRELKVGNLITIERGRSKCLCQVVWTADPDSALHGQFT